MIDDPYANPEPEPKTLRESSVLTLVVGVLAVLLLLVGGIAVVTHDDEKVDAVTLLGSAPDAVRDAGSARMTMTMTMEGEGMSMDMSAEGVVDFVSGAGTFKMTGFGADFEMITDGKTMWMHVPNFAALPHVGKEWIAFPTSNGAGTMSGLFGPDQATGFLDTLRGVGGEIEDLGTEEVNGVDAHHYGVTIDMARALESIPDDERADAEAGMAMLGGDATMPVEVWLSDGGLPVRVTFDIGGGTGVTPMEMHMQMDLTDFGLPVEITPPPADQVLNISDPSELSNMLSGEDVS